jgi:hypothetical protein
MKKKHEDFRPVHLGVIDLGDVDHVVLPLILRPL